MSVAGIPRLQELTYLATAAQAVDEGKPFEQIRMAVFDWAKLHAEENDSTGSFDADKWEKRRADRAAYFRNTVVVLKELMRLGWVKRHDLPSTPGSARAHAHVMLTTTPTGREWTELVTREPLDGFDALAGALIEAHPQFEAFLRLVGARPDSVASHLTIPLMRSGGSSRHDDVNYLSSFVAYVVEKVRTSDLGWSASPEVIEGALRDYVSRAVCRDARRAEAEPDLSAREKRRKETGSRKRLVALCEEAAVRLAFTAAGCPLDYVSHELLRRWTRFLGLANFSYYVPGPSALRIWKTADVIGSGPATEFRRAVGDATRRAAMEIVPVVWRAEEQLAAQNMFLPVWRIRAAVCWERRISDSEFDAALTAAVRGEIPDLAFQVHLDGASGGRTPRSTKPLVLATASGHRIYHVMRVYGADQLQEISV
ncbi:hypothetical protein [Streptomyces sp. NPDC058280]|uniref:hypothetical protein n=1 Tax=Streptomyces sp. NPDC058280 TaxID=3346419 RepID=UPI0036E1BB2A